jgi:DNA invertase Pin-like site-specific DNA recombinase
MNKLDFPDKDRREPGEVQLRTAQAMRDAKGDRKVAAKALGITLHTLSSRLHIIRSIRDGQK